LAAVVYDLIACKMPQLFVDTAVLPLFRKWARNLLGAADLVCTISEHSRRDIYSFAQECDLPPPPVEVFRLGDGSLADATPVEFDQVAGLTRADRFALMVCTLEVRKNHLLAYQAWRRLLETRGPAGLPRLVLAGSPGWLTGDLLAQLRHDPLTRQHVLLVHGAGDAELAWLYRHCLFTLYPSHYEGWGLPVAESLAFGKLCIASDSSSIPEVGGDLVDYHDPLDGPGLVRLLERAVFDDAYRAARERQVRACYRKTTWEGSARMLLALLEKHFGRLAVRTGMERG
jgi:glycosyltransferase involved in cell wall biosynthesis